MENFDAFKREVIEMDITDLISEMKLTEDYFLIWLTLSVY